jgi:hypothetical protein
LETNVAELEAGVWGLVRCKGVDESAGNELADAGLAANEDMGFVAACALVGRIRFAAAKVVAFLFADTFTSAWEFKRASGAPAPNKAKQAN